MTSGRAYMSVLSACISTIQMSHLPEFSSPSAG